MPELLKLEGLLITVEDLKQPSTGVVGWLQNRCDVYKTQNSQAI